MPWILNENYRRRSHKERPEWIVVHYPGCPGASAEAVITSLMNSSRRCSTHFAVDEFKVVHGVDVRYAAFHCGGRSESLNGCYNGNAIGVDLCDEKFNKRSKKASDNDWYIKPLTLDRGAALIATLMYEYKIDIDHVCRHYDVTGKLCPSPMVGKDRRSYNYPDKSCEDVWLDFKQKILQAYRRYDNVS